MNHTRQRGFVTMLAVTSLALLATAAVIITQTSFALRFQSDQAYAAACNRNLAGSALAWAEGRRLAQGEHTQLDVSALNIPGGVLRIAPAKSSQSKDSLRIDTECRFGRFHLNRSDVYVMLSSRITRSRLCHKDLRQVAIGCPWRAGRMNTGLPS
jgi:hypothetical protein